MAKFYFLLDADKNTVSDAKKKLTKIFKKVNLKITNVKKANKKIMTADGMMRPFEYKYKTTSNKILKKIK